MNNMDYSSNNSATNCIDVETQAFFDEAYDMMVNQGFSASFTANTLTEKVLDENVANAITAYIAENIVVIESDEECEEIDNSPATCIIVGLVFLIGGIIASMSSSYIFIGAIVWGLHWLDHSDNTRLGDMDWCRRLSWLYGLDFNNNTQLGNKDW